MRPAGGLAALSLSTFLRARWRPLLWPCSRVGPAFSMLFTSSIVALERRAAGMDPRSSLAAAMMLSRKLFRLELPAGTLLANLVLLPFGAPLLLKLVLVLLLLLLLVVPFKLVGLLLLLLMVLLLVPLKLVGDLLLLLVLAPLKLVCVL